ncbi:hypothetical protein K5549_021172, partial [Capra hircus]
MRLVTGVTVLLTLGIMVDVEITQLSSMDCAEGEDVNLPCNHSTIDALDYIHWYRQTPNQSPQYVIHGFQDTVNSSMSSLNVSFRQKVQHLGPVPGHPERHRCVLLCPERGTLGQMGLHLCSISRGGRRGGHSW